MNNLFGKLVNIESNTLIYENNSKIASLQYLNFHVAIPEGEETFIGEIIAINEDIIAVLLVGQIINNEFKSGIIKKPVNPSGVRFIYTEELFKMIGYQEESLDRIQIGRSSIYKQYYVNADAIKFLSGHFAIIGNSGSGKSCATARIIQNILKQKQGKIPEEAHIVLFDAYGEYNQAFSKINETIGLNTKIINSIVADTTEETLNIPFFLLDIDDLALLLNVNDTESLHVIEKAKKLVYVFKSNDERANIYKNDIIAECIMDILTSGRNSNQIRDQIIAVLTKYNTNVLSLESEINQPGYRRTLRQCLNIDDQGKINAIALVIDFLQQFIKVDIEDLKPDYNFDYSIDDFYYALEFALMSEGTINSSRSYEKMNNLKVRLSSIINSDSKELFKTKGYIEPKTFVEEFFKNNGEACQLVNVNISHVDDRLAKTLTKIYARLFFEYTAELKERGSYSIHIILEEAHRYIQNDADSNIIGYNIFERISKEGRKYGTILGLISQRPSELSTTVLSQCTNFIIFRMFHPDDISIINKITTNINEESLEQIKSLQPGSALVFGNAFPLGTIVKFDLPNPKPNSDNFNALEKWFK